ncbi:hypothetical protein [Paenibacillus sp. A14]|uniref:hypothetical protein n=1 Tax=Paenibacillus sp. A14 TaxID=3119820 RepID=UPI002FE0DB9A
MVFLGFARLSVIRGRWEPPSQKDANLQEFSAIERAMREIDANLQEFIEIFLKGEDFAQKTCRFAGIIKFRPHGGEKPADLQEFAREEGSSRSHFEISASKRLTSAY